MSWNVLITFIFCITITLVSVVFLGHFNYDTQTEIGIDKTTIGAWDSGESYVVGDMVTYSGSDYVCIEANTNITPNKRFLWWNLNEDWHWKLTDDTDMDSLMDSTVDDSLLATMGNGIKIYTKVMGFGVDDVPEVFSYIFWFISIVEVLCIVFLVRGVG